MGREKGSHVIYFCQRGQKPLPWTFCSFCTRKEKGINWWRRCDGGQNFPDYNSGNFTSQKRFRQVSKNNTKVSSNVFDEVNQYWLWDPLWLGWEGQHIYVSNSLLSPPAGKHRQENLWTNCSVPLQILGNYAGIATQYVSDGTHKQPVRAHFKLISKIHTFLNFGNKICAVT